MTLFCLQGWIGKTVWLLGRFWTFCGIFGQKVSQDKSRVFFSPNVSADDRTDLCNILGFRSTPSLRKYLGFPNKQSSTPQDFGFILERVQGRLAGWKANPLFFSHPSHDLHNSELCDAMHCFTY
ncbi:hypothetical protein SO802_028620 [Lithocarpus litseifolius]|uniref:Uncharacterized protein n=1 Tax=Lithocarpus litseifolius TaxID=425828 RepID=A0AAW2BQS7_9ROSI